MNSFYLLKAGLHPSQKKLTEAAKWWDKTLSQRLDEKELVTFRDVYDRIRRFQNRLMTLKESLSVYYRTKGPKPYDWAMIPRGQKIEVKRLEDPVTYLEPIDKRAPIRHVIRGSDPSLALLMNRPWVNTSFMIEVYDPTERLLPNAAECMYDDSVRAVCRIFDLLYSLEPEAFEIIETYLKKF